jgi:hypothetical protein
VLIAYQLPLIFRQFLQVEVVNTILKSLSCKSRTLYPPMLKDILEKKIERLEKQQAAKQVKAIASPPPASKAASPEKLAEIGLNPLYAAAQSLTHLTNMNLDALPAFMGELRHQTEALKKGDVSQLEQILQAQAITLNVAFNHFLIKANGAAQIDTILANRPELIEMFARLAFKCQDQSRKTLATLAELKNPKRSTTFIKNYVDKQLNQLNVDEPSPQPTTGAAVTPQLQEDTRAPLDTGSQSEAGRTYQEVEAVGTQHRPSNRGGKRAKRSKQH